MKIAVIGPGSMGLLYGAKLSKCAQVTLIGNNKEHIRGINENGVTVKREDSEQHFDIRAALNGQESDIYVVKHFDKEYPKEANKITDVQ